MLLLLLSSPAFATSVVAVRNNDEIVMGADSKTTLTPAFDRSGTPDAVTKCKIVQTGNLFFASAGSAGIVPATLRLNGDPDLDLKEVIAEVLGGEGGIGEKVDNLEKILAVSLTQIAEKARQESAAFFLERFVKRPLHTVIIAGLDHEELVLMVRTFRLVVSMSGALSVEIGRFACPGDCQAAFITVFEGRTEAIREYLRQNEHFLSYNDPATAVRGLVELEISKDPSFVGPPVDILRLTRQGAEWLQRKSLCPDIQRNAFLP
jgi:hypothetical protein